MLEAEFIRNISAEFNCQELLNQLKNVTGELHRGHEIAKPNTTEAEAYLQQRQNALDAGYMEVNSVQFYHYKPKTHFDPKFVDTFANIVKATPLRVFISEIRPGRMVPWHWDIDNDTEYEGRVVRYHVHLSQPAPGHIFMLGNQAIYNREQGDMFKWNTHTAWHAGANCGFSTKFLFNFKGYQ